MTRIFGARLLRGLGAAALVAALAGPATLATPLAQAAPLAHAARASGCLVGSWSSVDVETYARSALGQRGSAAVIEGVSGTMRMQFHADDTFTQYFDNMVVRAQARGMAAVQTVNGDASGRFAEEAPGELVLSGQDAAIAMDMSIDGQVIMQGADMSGMAIASREFGATRASYTCAGDRLELSPNFSDGRPVSPMVFERSA